MVYTATYVSIYLNGEWIAYHLRDRTPYKYTTDKENIPSSHQFVSEWKPVKFIEWTGRIHLMLEVIYEKCWIINHIQNRRIEAAWESYPLKRKQGKNV